MSGLMFAGMALGGIHIANAQNNVNPEIDNSRYTVVIPSEVNIDKNTGKGSFAVTGKVKAQSTIDVSIQSKNGYKLKDKNGELPYNIDKKSFSIDNSRSASDIPLNEEFDIVSKTNTKVSGNYTDSLTFDITGKRYEYRLDINGSLDGGGAGDGSLTKFGRFDIYVDGKLYQKDVDDFCSGLPYGSTWELKNIRSLDGYHYEKSPKVPTKGVVGENIEWEGYINENQTYRCRAAYVTLKFYTNKLKVNYYPNGAQKHNDAKDYNDASKDETIDSQKLHYSASYKYDEDLPSFGLDNVARFKRVGYTSNHTYLVGSPTSSIKVDDGDNIYKKAQDLADTAGLLADFKKNDVTINLYPEWSPIVSQLNLNANGGSFSDNSSFKTATDKLVYDSSLNANISTYTPTRKGYDFDGWYTDETGGAKVYNADGSAVNGTQYWQNNVYQNIESTNILRGDDGQDMAKHKLYALDPVENNIVDNGWVNDTELSYGKCKKITINNVHAGDDKTTGIYTLFINEYCKRTALPYDALRNKKLTLSFKIKSDTPMTFERWGIENTTAYSPYTLKTTQEWQTFKVNTTITDSMLSHNNALVFYTLSTTGTFYVGDVSITLDTDIELFAHWKYKTGTILNIEGSNYIVMGQTEDRNYRLISGTSIGSIQYQPNQDANGNYYNIGQYDENIEQDKRYDGQDSNTYENSYIDKFLENTWYTSLSPKMQNAIVATQIKQSSYKEIGHGRNCELLSDTDKAATDGSDWYYNEGSSDNPKWVIYYKHNWVENDEGILPLKVWNKQDAGYSGQKYNTISRHVYLPSLSEINELVDLNDANKTYAFTEGTKGNATHVWLRDSNTNSPRWALGISKTYRSLCRHYVSSAWFDMRPAFVIDLSKIDYTVTGTVNYK